MNAATDNPLVFPEAETVISGGNFHGQPISQAMDILAIALAQLGNISERRIECMMDPSTSDHLPPFLTPQPGAELRPDDGPGDGCRAGVGEQDPCPSRLRG